MSFTMMAKAKPIKTGHSGRKLVLMMLADISDDNGRCFPSYQHLADACEMSRRSVITHMNTLEEMGIITKEARKGVKGNSSNIYTLHIPAQTIEGGGENISLGGENSALPPSENSAPITYHSTNLSVNHNTSDDVQAVFEYWQIGFGKQQAKLTAARKTKIQSRLKEGYSVDDLKKAIRGCSKSKFHMGENDNKTVYNDLTLICRNGENVERFKEYDNLPPIDQQERTKAEKRASVTAAALDINNLDW